MWKCIKQLFIRFNRAHRTYLITFDEAEIQMHPPVRKLVKIKWKELVAVIAFKTNDGPGLPNVWLGLMGKNSHCCIPLCAEGSTTLLAQLYTLKGFKKGVLEKMQDTPGDSKKICWSLKTINQGDNTVT